MAPLIRSLLITAIVAAGLYLIWPDPPDSKPSAMAIPAAEADEKINEATNPEAQTKKQEKRTLQGQDTDDVASRTGALNRLEIASQKSWMPVVDLNTRRLKTLKGGVLDLAPTTPREKSDEFIRDYAADLFGVDPKDLSFERAIKTDRVKVVYQQIIGGVRVFTGTLALVYDEGLLMRVQSDLSALPVEAEAALLSIAEAEKLVQTYGAQILNGGGNQVTLVASGPGLKTELVYFPSAKNLVLAYQMIVDVWTDAKHSQRMKVLVNAHDGAFIQSRNLRID